MYAGQSRWHRQASRVRLAATCPSGGALIVAPRRRTRRTWKAGNVARILWRGKLIMDKVEALPSAPRIYRVQTCSGTVHISSRYSEGTTWERRPAATTTMVGTCDFQPVPVTLTNDNWKNRRERFPHYFRRNVSHRAELASDRDDHLDFRTDARMTLDPDASGERLGGRYCPVIRRLRQAIFVFPCSHV